MRRVTRQPRELSHFSDRIDGVLGTFDGIRWYRSDDGEQGPYLPITGSAPDAAHLSTMRKEPYALAGKELVIETAGAVEVQITFVGPDPMTAAQVAAEINGATPLVVASDVGGYLHLESAATGTEAYLILPQSEGALLLGFAAGSQSHGKDQDTPLVSGIYEYFYTDEQSAEDAWYRVEYVDSVLGKSSGLKPAFPAETRDTVPKTETLVAYLRLVDAGGYPIQGRKVTLFNTFLPNRVDARGVFRQSIQMETDKNGYASTRVLRGIEVDMAIDGTGFVRRLTIPSTGAMVDLLDPSLESRDEFGIQVPDLDYAIRTSF